MLFKAGERPDVKSIAAFSHKSDSFTLSHPSNEFGFDKPHWLELIANGLSFDLTGLSPGEGNVLPFLHHSFDLPQSFEADQYEAITLSPGPHLAGGGMMYPILRCLAWLGAVLSNLPGNAAIIWHPAGAYNCPNYFKDNVQIWIEGGVFPGLGLAGLELTEDGGMQSRGLAAFTSQELYLSAEFLTDKAQGAQMALRLLNWLVDHGKLNEISSLTGPSGNQLLLDPHQTKGLIRVTSG